MTQSITWDQICEYVTTSPTNMKNNFCSVNMSIVRESILTSTDPVEIEEIFQQYLLSQDLELRKSCENYAHTREYSDGVIAYEYGKLLPGEEISSEVLENTEKNIKYRTYHWLCKKLSNSPYALFFVTCDYYLSSCIV